MRRGSLMTLIAIPSLSCSTYWGCWPIASAIGLPKEQRPATLTAWIVVELAFLREVSTDRQLCDLTLPTPGWDLVRGAESLSLLSPFRVLNATWERCYATPATIVLFLESTAIDPCPIRIDRVLFCLQVRPSYAANIVAASEPRRTLIVFAPFQQGAFQSALIHL